MLKQRLQYGGLQDTHVERPNTWQSYATDTMDVEVTCQGLARAFLIVPPTAPTYLVAQLPHVIWDLQQSQQPLPRSATFGIEQIGHAFPS